MAEYILRDQAIIAVTGAKLPDVSASGLPIANGKRSVTDCVRRLKEIPAADVRPRWIPVTERLPKEGEFVLVHGNFYPNKHDGGVIAVSKRMDWNYWQGFGREIDITHWMSLPPAPKEE